MKGRRGVRDWFRLRPSRPREVEHHVDEEIALHIELRARELMAHGMVEDAAWSEAARRFGGAGDARSRLQRAARTRERRTSMREWLLGWVQDVRYSARGLWHDRSVTVVIVLTLALGIGANTIMFGVIDHLLLRGPSHVVDPDDVRRVYTTEERFTGYGTSWTHGYVVYTLLRDNASSFSGVAAYRTGTERYGIGEAAREMNVGWATADIFPLLGVQPWIGRFFTAGEDRPGDAVRVAVLDYEFWKSEFGGASDVLGSTVRIGRWDYEVIGVAPPRFTGPEREPVNVWLPATTDFARRPDWPTTWNASWLRVIVRMRSDIAFEAAAEEATSIYRAGAEGHRTSATEATLSLLPLSHGPTGVERSEAAVSRWLFGVSVIVLLTAAANVANLLLARTLRRGRELAVRRALGVSRTRLARLLLSESLVLAVAGLAVALLFTYWGGQAVRTVLLPDVQWGAVLGGRTLLFAVSTALLTGVLVGLVPALRSGRHNLTRGLRSGAGEGGGRRARTRSVLTVAQAAFSVVLLVGAGLFVRSLWNVRRLDLGIDADRVLAVWPDLAVPTGPDAFAVMMRRIEQFMDQAVARLSSHPGVERVALGLGTPLQGGFSVALRAPGRDSIPTLESGGPFITADTPTYFETVGTRILRGRGFEDGEGAGTEPIVVVNETMAITLWPGEDPLTKCLIIGAADAPCARVVGVAENTHRTGIIQEPAMHYYIPLGQEHGIGGTQILVRPLGEATAFIPELRRALFALDPSARYFRVNHLQDVLDPQIRPWRLGSTMFLAFGVLALLIAAIGLYSVMAHGVAQRRSEIGVRMALGARTRGVVAMIVREGTGLVLVGILIGLFVAFAVAPRIEHLLFGTAARDTLVMAAVAMVLAVVAVLASAIPAVRAGRTDPLSALRSD